MFHIKFSKVIILVIFIISVWFLRQNAPLNTTNKLTDKNQNTVQQGVNIHINYPQHLRKTDFFNKDFIEYGYTLISPEIIDVNNAYTTDNLLYTNQTITRGMTDDGVRIIKGLFIRVAQRDFPNPEDVKSTKKQFEGVAEKVDLNGIQAYKINKQFSGGGYKGEYTSFSIIRDNLILFIFAAYPVNSKEYGKVFNQIISTLRLE